MEAERVSLSTLTAKKLLADVLAPTNSLLRDGRPLTGIHGRCEICQHRSINYYTLSAIVFQNARLTAMLTNDIR